MREIMKIVKKLLLLSCIGHVAYSASVDHLMNQSPAYLGNPAQNAIISVDGSNYNPAGIVHLEDGRYLQIGNQFGFIHEGMKSEGKDYDSDTFEPVIPNINFVNKKGSTATYFSIGVIGGGATLEYDDGVPGSGKIPGILKQLGFANAYMTDSSFEGSNKYFGATLGRAWALNEKWSVSAAGRVVYATRELKGYAKYDGVPDKYAPKKDFTIDSEREAWGVGGIFGVNYMPNDRWNFAARYETKVKLKFEADATDSPAEILGQKIGFLDFYPQYADGDKRYRDLPAMLALGASHKLTDKLVIMAGGNYYFVKDADLDGQSGYDNGYELNIGMEYLINEKLSWTLGYNYADTGAGEETYSDVEYALDSHIIGTGIKYRPNPNQEWVLSVAQISYDTATAPGEVKDFGNKGTKASYPSVKYEKNFLAFGISCTMKF
jgi:long-chain fatty acid transport protein